MLNYRAPQWRERGENPRLMHLDVYSPRHPLPSTRCPGCGESLARKYEEKMNLEQYLQRYLLSVTWKDVNAIHNRS